MKKVILAAFIGVTLLSCGPSTKIVKSWVEPGATVTAAPENNTLVISLVKDETSRRVIEDQLVKKLTGKATASYTILSSEAIKQANEEALSQLVTQGKYTHILLMRLADIEKETSYVPGTTTGGYYGGYGRYYGYGAGMYSTPGYYTTDKNYFVETMVYSTNPNKLLWTGTTKTVNPSKIEKTVNDIATAVSERMKKDGFIK